MREIEDTRQDRLYFRQILAGRDFAVGDPVAGQMVNFCYMIGDRETKEAVVVDPAYDIDGILAVLAADDMNCSGVLATHYHPDHVGGDLMGYPIEGIAHLLDRALVPVHVQREEAPWVEVVTGVGRDDLVQHESGDIVDVGSVSIELVHTPGHTPGSQCFLVDGRLVSGDTLFLQGCGRTDFPGGDPEQMYESLVNRLGRIPDETVLYPGHMYTTENSASMGDTRKSNAVFRPHSLDQWMMAFGR